MKSLLRRLTGRTPAAPPADIDPAVFRTELEIEDAQQLLNQASDALRTYKLHRNPTSALAARHTLTDTRTAVDRARRVLSGLTTPAGP